MKKVTVFVALAALVTLVSCNNSKNTTNNGNTTVETEEIKELANFPEAKEGFDRYVIVLDEKASDEAEFQYKVEIVPGKMMEVDCNQHRLAAKITEQTVTGFGYTYYEIESDGNVASTMKACPDNKLTNKFVSGASQIVRYNSKLPIVVYVPKGFDVKYKIWEATEPQNALTDNADALKNASKDLESVKNLAHYPKAEKDAERFVVLPEPKGEMEVENQYQIEIVPGKMMEVDCNRHTLMGAITQSDVKGFGYIFYNFKSEGNASATMMACPDNTKTTKFVSGQTEMARYNSRLPLVVYAPKGFDVKYKIWSAKDLQNAKMN